MRPNGRPSCPRRVKSPELLETLATAVPALQLGSPDGPLSNAVQGACKRPRSAAIFRARAQSSAPGAVSQQRQGQVALSSMS